MRLGSALLFAFAILTGPAQAAGAPAVLVTIKPIHSLVAAVMAGVGTPQLLIGGATSEHSYVLRPSDARKIEAARLVFWVGPDLETFLRTPLANLAENARVVALEHAKGVRLLAARPGGLWNTPPRLANGGHPNPHVWLDPANAIAMTYAIATALASSDPLHAKTYSANAANEVARIAGLDRTLKAMLEPVHKRPYIVFHDAYPYFEVHYGLSPIGAVTVEPDRPVGPRRIAVLRQAIEAGKAVCIFREPQFPPSLIATLATGTKVRTGVLDPLGADLAPGPQLYPQLMTRMAENLRDCLAGRP